MSPSNGKRPNQLSAEIRRQIGTAANTRYLRALPDFKVDQKLPDQFDRLLRKIDKAERQSRPTPRS